MPPVTRVGIIGGGPGGYEAALVAAQLGAEVTVVDSDGLGGSAVLTDCVPSKTLIATAEVMTDTAESGELGVLVGAGDWIDARGEKKHIRGYLKEFLFAPELTEAPIASLSGGEPVSGAIIPQ